MNKIVIAWFYPVITYILGDSITTVFGVKNNYFTEYNEFVIALGLDNNLIKLFLFKCLLLLFLFTVNYSIIYSIKLLGLYEEISKMKYIMPIIIGLLGHIALVNNALLIIF